MNLLSEDALKKYKDSNLYEICHDYHPEADEFVPMVVTRYDRKEDTHTDVDTPTKMIKKVEDKNLDKSIYHDSMMPNKVIGNGPTDQQPQDDFTKKKLETRENIRKQTKIENEKLEKELDQRLAKSATHSNSTSIQESTHSVSVSVPTQQKAEKQKESPKVKPQPKTSTGPDTMAKHRPTHNQENKTNSMTSLAKIIKPATSKKIVASASEDHTFIDIKDSLKTASWLRQANQYKVEISNSISTLKLNKIKLRSLRNNQKQYIPIDSQLLHLLGSIIIGKQLDIIFIFRDGTTLSIAPKSWVNNNEQTLLNNNYEYYYFDLDVKELIEELKPLSASNINTKDYTQLWLKFIPVIPIND